MARLLFGLGVAAVIFTIYAVADCAFFDRTRIRGLRRGWWIVVILFVPIIGGLLWFIIGRGRASRVGPSRGGTVAPDDDAEFLRHLREDAAQDERIRRMEQELAELDDEFHNGTTPGTGRTPGSGTPTPDDGFESGSDTLGTEHKHPDAPEAPGEAGPSGRPNG
ncbi:PLD nuclease N-terminal domain-containing protein [Agromyces sp. Soil535]|uniref:PLD nuclease N-terminal domain-containing protein n=1 Tax=Agromyces sp. Soil535 TaxID=1736390 RepID=UPI0009E76FCA|nr:PLD nuclease N-terminal domain-containing protein [Agromyces sp. Soil535]